MWTRYPDKQTPRVPRVTKIYELQGGETKPEPLRDRPVENEVAILCRVSFCMMYVCPSLIGEGSSENWPVPFMYLTNIHLFFNHTKEHIPDARENDFFWKNVKTLSKSLIICKMQKQTLGLTPM